MKITTMTSREFNRNISGAKNASKKGPVFITDRGRPAHVWLTIEDYRKLVSDQTTIVEMLALPDAEDIEFEPARLSGDLYHSADLS
jgi:PHD/YefM family antitoxin component YafN of YafNO toxin-antitoxin module